MGGRISQIKQQLFGQGTDYVCGGHGAIRPSHGTFKVPKGIVIKFYVPHGRGLPNAKGKLVDQILNGGAAPAAFETVNPGTTCHNYHLYSSRAGGYLNLANSSQANSRYITTTDKDNGISLQEICKLVTAKSAAAVIHWSACRSRENDGDTFGWSKPVYKGKLGKLAKR